MVHKSINRRLAAILAADVVGYSLLMAEDEDATRAQFNAHLENLITHKINGHHGRLVKVMGDGLLVEFASAVDAVRCASDLQNELIKANENLPKARRMQFRMGVNLGDVIVEGDDIHGDGVNVAARLEALAEPDGIIVSSVVHEIVRTKVNLSFDDLGAQKVKNISEPIRAFRLLREGELSGMQSQSAGVRRPLPEKPSIAVLPFVNLGGDPDQEYFADGITEDLITDLSKITGMFVVARNSSFAFKGSDTDSQTIASELGVQHVLEGSVRRAGDRVRINARLIEAESRGQLWAERFDGQFADIFALQDIINAKIVMSLRLHLAPIVSEDLNRQRTDNTEAYDLFLQGRADYYLYTQDSIASAQQHFEKAIDIDPRYSEAYAFLAHCLTTAYVFAWSGSEGNLDMAVEHAEKSIALDDRSAVGYARLGWIQGYLDQFDQAVENFERAISLNPRSAEAFYTYGETMNKRGDPQRGLPLLEHAFSIDSIVPPSWDFAKAHSFVLMGRFDDAAILLRNVTERAPRFLPARVQLARALAEQNQVSDARDMVKTIRELSPHFELRDVHRMFPYPDEEQRTQLNEALAAAGL